MCKFCEPIVNCPVGKKAISIIESRFEGRERFKLIRDHAEDYDDIFVTVTSTDLLTGYSNNHPFDINNCPMCGQRLRSGENDND